MSLSNLIRGKSEPVRFATATVATIATLDREKGRTVASVATVAVANPKAEAVDVGDNYPTHVNENSCNVIQMVRSSTEARLKKVREMLADNPDLFYAVLTEEEDNDMRVAIGIKAKGVVELAIPIHKYDTFKLMQLIEKYGAGK